VTDQVPARCSGDLPRHQARHLGVEEDFRPARKAHPGLLVHDLDAWAGRLRAAGAAVLFDDDFPGMRRFYSEDPHGNMLEFLEPADEV